MRRTTVKTAAHPRLARTTIAAAAAVLAVGGFVVASGPASGVGAACWDDVLTDVDGGGPDAIVGLPSYDLPGKPDAGAIVVYSNVGTKGEADPKGPSARLLLTADDFDGLSSQAKARFGSAVVVWMDAGSYDDPDDCADLMIGAPGQTVGGKSGAGQVYQLKGTPDGLNGVRQVWDESRITGVGGVQAGAAFGTSIAAVTLNTIAIGAPGRDVDGAANAGRVVRLDYTTSDVPPNVQVIEQGGSEAGAAEANDRFGEVLKLMPTGEGPILVVGIPHEDVGTKVDAGAVGMMPQSEHLTLVTQNSPGAGGTAETGDRYGASIDGYFTYTNQTIGVVVIGVPGEDVSGDTNAGLASFASFKLGQNPDDDEVTAITGWSRTMDQNAKGVAGGREPGDAYGSAVLAGEFGRDSGALHLVITAPRENLGRIVDAGLLGMTVVSPTTAAAVNSQALAWHQDSPEVAGRAEAGDQFGAAMSSVLLTTLEDDDDSVWSVVLVTVPGEDLSGVSNAGMAYLGFAPGARSVGLVPPVRQSGAGIGMVPMQLG